MTSSSGLAFELGYPRGQRELTLREGLKSSNRPVPQYEWFGASLQVEPGERARPCSTRRARRRDGRGHDEDGGAGSCPRARSGRTRGAKRVEISCASNHRSNVQSMELPPATKGLRSFHGPLRDVRFPDADVERLELLIVAARDAAVAVAHVEASLAAAREALADKERGIRGDGARSPIVRCLCDGATRAPRLARGNGGAPAAAEVARGRRGRWKRTRRPPRSSVTLRAAAAASASAAAVARSTRHAPRPG